MKNIKFLNLVWILFYLTIFFILLNNSFSYLDNDLGWHLKVGEQILVEKSVPNFDYYNYTLEGRTWVDHEWLINAITYWIYNNFGYLALNIFFALIIIITLIILQIIIYKYVLIKKNGLIFFILFGVLGIIASLPHLGIRMQEITLLNISILLLIIYHYNKNKNFKILFFLVPLFWFWAGMHAGFLIGIFILFFWIFIKLVENLLSRTKYLKLINYEKRLTIKEISVFSLFSLSSVIITLLTPYGLKFYSFLSYYKNDFYLTKIMEWFPFYYLPIEYWQLFYSSIVVVAIILIFYLYFRKKINKKINLWEISILIFFLILALKSKRHFPLLFIVSLPILVSLFSYYFNPLNDNFLNKKWAKQFFIVKPYIIIALLTIISLKLIDTKFISDPFIIHGYKYPKDAVTFLKNHPEYDDKKLFNKYGWGGYLIWTMPERKLFIDGRLPMLPFAGHTFLEEYFKFFKKNMTERKLKEYNIGLILIPSKERYYKLNWFEKYFLLLNEEEINKSENHFKNFLSQSKNWDLVYTDDVSNIYVKTKN